ncbi:MAG: hypothetical protein M3Z35_00290 [Nitrospirota bacterium]|nr:hypothetical protein [Nitrospirota bacterium]
MRNDLVGGPVLRFKIQDSCLRTAVENGNHPNVKEVAWFQPVAFFISERRQKWGKVIAAFDTCYYNADFELRESAGVFEVHWRAHGIVLHTPVSAASSWSATWTREAHGV